MIKKEIVFIVLFIFSLICSILMAAIFIIAAENHCKDIKCDKEYVKKLKAENNIRKMALICVCCSLNEKLVNDITSTLVEILDNGNEKVRLDVVGALSNCKNPIALTTLTKVLEEDPDYWVRWGATYALGEIGDPSTVPALIEALKKDPNYKVKQGAADALVKIKDPSVVRALTKVLEEDPNDMVRWEAVYALGKIEDPSVVPALIKALGDQDYEVRWEAVYAISKIKKDEKSVNSLINALKINGPIEEVIEVLSTVDLKPFSEEFKKSISINIASAINEILDNYKDKENLAFYSQKFAVLINKLHDNDDLKDLVRTKIIENLTLKSKYYLIALGGSDLYTSSFFKIYNTIIKNENWLNEIKAIDPNDDYSTDFILTLSSFGVLKENIKKDLDYFFPALKNSLKNEEKIIQNAGMLVLTIASILADKSLRDFNIKIQDMLLELYDEYNKIQFLDGKAAIGYIIKSNKEYFENENKDKAEKISAELPEILPPNVPEEWLNDGKLTAKLYFYPDEAWFQITRNYFANQIGIINIIEKNDKKDESEDSTIIIKLKRGNNIRIKKEFLKKEGINLDVKGHTATIKLKKGKYIDLDIEEGKERKTFINKGLTIYHDGTTIIKKQLKNIEIDIILTLNNEDVKEVLKDQTIDIMAHRGHSYHVRKTFPEITVNCNKKLLYIGSCGSFRVVPNLQETYDDCYYITDQDVGRGEDNNRLLDSLVFSIAYGERDWNQIKRVLDEINAEGIVYPHDKAMLIYDFVKKVKGKDIIS